MSSESETREWPKGAGAMAAEILGEQLGANRVAYVQVSDDEYIIERNWWS